MNRKPFITFGYEGPEFFCDRQKETSDLTRLVRKGSHAPIVQMNLSDVDVVAHSRYDMSYK